MAQGLNKKLPELSFPLFVPGDRPERFAKAQNAGSDTVVIDLEDAVAPDNKVAARDGLRDTLRAHAGVQTVLRINGAGTQWHEGDLAAAAALDIDAVMLPKAESPEELAATRAKIGAGRGVLAIIESADGLANLRQIAPAADRLAFGSIDYCADVGMAHTRRALLSARSEVVLAARLANQIRPLDGVSTEIHDAEQIKSDAMHSQEMGFGGKLLIHPAQITPAKQGFAPTDADLTWAQGVLQASSDGGAATYQGQMVDAPVLARARAILQLQKDLT
ncbi:MAG: CoA ester lyase [Marinosulfonomonas sp.]|nr:CoA ester lyase [Marinosulfonomonas sp.]